MPCGNAQQRVVVQGHPHVCGLLIDLKIVWLKTWVVQRAHDNAHARIALHLHLDRRCVLRFKVLHDIVQQAPAPIRWFGSVEQSPAS